MSYSRRNLLAALNRYGVILLREGGGHTIVRGPSGRQSSIPRHNQLNRATTRKIIKQLGLTWDQIEKEIA